MTHISIEAYSAQALTLDFSDRMVFLEVELWNKSGMISSNRSKHPHRVAEVIEGLAKKFVTDWNLDNKTAENDTGDSKRSATTPGDTNLKPWEVTPARENVPDWARDAAPATREKPQADSGAPPGAPSRPAKPNVFDIFDYLHQVKQHEIVDVKYRGPIDLAPFLCGDITRSSFIQRVCYDTKNTYMLIKLSGAWYHYCEIDPTTVASLLDAESMGRMFNASIKGRFDCRTHRVPAYENAP